MPGYECRHNLTYWNNWPYIGIGAGAYSYINGVRSANERNIRLYMLFLQKNKLAKVQQEKLSREKKMGETIMLSLRLIKGMNIREFERRFNIVFRDCYKDRIDELKELGLIKINSQYMRLSARGLLLADEVFQYFI